MAPPPCTGLCFNVGPGVPTGRAPHTRVAPCRSQLSRAEENRRLLRPEGPLFALCRMRYARARGQRQQLGVFRAAPPRWGPPCRTFPCGKKRGRRGGSASSAATAHAHPGGRGASRRHARGLRPCTRSASPGAGLRSSGRAPSRQRGLPARGVFYVGAGSATSARPVLARTCLDHRAGSAARSLSSP